MKWNPRFIKSLATAVIAAQVLYPSTSFAVLNIYNAPLYVNSSIKASVMLDISKDNQLYYKAFSDYSDLDGLTDAQGNLGLETTYTHGVDYYGYFDSYKCYDYNAGNGRFEPRTVKVKDKSVADHLEPNLTAKYCGGNWSGNFLNWVTMSRMDAVRKLLYGGYRQVDGAAGSDTVLERTFIPTDAHSWAKYYSGTDLNRLSPYTAPTVPVAYASVSSLEVLAPQYNVTIVTAGTVATVTTPTTHNFNVGQSVSIFGALNDNNYNGVKTILAAPAPTATKFSFTIAAGALSPATGKINVFPRQTAAITGAGTYPISAGDQLVFKNGASNVIEVSVVSSTGGANPTIVMEHTAATGLGTFIAWTVTNLNSTGMSFCNTTRAVGYAGTSQALDTNVYPPLMRVARGNFSLWSANERWQCNWREERSDLQGSFAGGFLSNGNRPSQSGIFASAENPSTALHGPGGTTDFIARVQVCVPALLGEERCKRYPSLNYKPVGLLQIYGDINLINYGLFTGSYDKNISGGVLRKNVGSFNDEVAVNTDGRFIAPATGGIVDTMNRLRIYGYRYSDGTYISSGTNEDDCPYQIIELLHSGAGTSQRNEGNCSTWGNPMSEIFLESVRYLAGKQPTPAFRQSAGGKDTVLGLKEATWTDPINTQNYCTPLNVLLFNTASPSYDDDQFAGMTDINQPAGAAITLTNKVGDTEGITGGNYFVGNVGATILDNCVPKVVTSLGAVTGICPEAASYNGSYLMAGVALAAHTTKIRTDIAVPAPPPPPKDDPFKKALKVDTYGIALSPTVPKIEIPIPGQPGQKVTIMPAYRLDLGTARYGGGSIVDFKVVRQDIMAGTGRFYVNWEDSGFGGDFDQDVIGIIDYCIPTALNGGCRVVPPTGSSFLVTNPAAVVVTTDVISAATANPQGFGYIISGTDQDGVHFHSGIYGFNYPPTPQTTFTPPSPNNFYTNVPRDSLNVVGCANCNITDAPSTWIYTRGATPSAKVLQDPLYYAAKYGAFEDRLDPPVTGAFNQLPGPDKCEFDSKDARGNIVKPCDPATGADGVPDTFFYVTNPNALESALDKAFTAILQNSSASSVAANSTSLRTGTRIYQATFNPNSWTGDLAAINVGPGGVIQTPPAWNAGSLMRPAPLGILDPATRMVITNKSTGRNGVAFKWASIDAAQQALLNTNPTTALADGQGSARLDYLRGSDANEGSSSASFRARSTSKLGDIVNSNPVFVGAPDAGYPDTSYQTFRLTPANAFRKSIVYVAANDGMLHGFCADASGGICSQGGKEAFAYVPSMVYPELTKLTMQGYQHKYYVDGTPTVQDVCMVASSTSTPCPLASWKTVLVGGVGAGGTGYFALDITNPDNFTEAAAASTLLWEIRKSDDPADLGVSIPAPVITKMANGRFAAIFGNGYNSTSGNAAVYVAFIDGTTFTPVGSDLIKISLASGPDNGASTVTAIDPNVDGIADAIYVGTLKGEMYKIDVTNANPANWNSGGNKTLLFRARDGSNNVQPITSPPEVTRHPAGGYVVLFGTGQYLQLADTVTPFNTQTFYGVHDDLSGATVTRAQLLARTITQSTATFRSVSNLPSTNLFGWYADLNISGERVIYAPQLFGGKIIFVTLIPSSSPCEAGGSGYLFEIDPVTGAGLPDPVFDVNGDGIIDSLDQPYSGKQSEVQIPSKPTFILPEKPTDLPVKFISGSSGNIQVEKQPKLPGGGRLSWRELLRD